MIKGVMSHPKLTPHPSAMNKHFTWTSERNPFNHGHSSVILNMNQRLSKKLIDIFAKIEGILADKTPMLPLSFPNSFAVMTETCLSPHLHGFERQKTSIGLSTCAVNCKTNIPLEKNPANWVSADNVTEKEPESCFGDCSCGFSILTIRKRSRKESGNFEKPTASNCSCRHCFQEHCFLSHRLRKNSRRRIKTSYARTSPFAVPCGLGRVIFILLLLGIHFQSSSAIPIRWDLGPFSDCTVSCGRGTQNRSVVCREMPEGYNHSASPYHRPKGNQMPDMMCPAPKPQESQACSQVACVPEWEYTLWEKCSKNCGRGKQTRDRRCMQRLGTGETVPVPEQHCPPTKVLLQRDCHHRLNCPPQWLHSQWSQCRSTCGKSFRTRSVICVQVRAGKVKPIRVPVNRCNQSSKPTSTRICVQPKCLHPLPRPVIRINQETIVQKSEQKKIRLQIGQRAHVIQGTVVVIKCLVKNFSANDIRWFFNGQEITRGQKYKIRVGILEDGSLRIIRARRADTGRYSCYAGASSAYSFLRITPKEKSAPLELDAPSDKHAPDSDDDLLREENIDPIDSDEVFHPVVSSSSSYDSHLVHRRRPILLLSPPPEVIPKVVRPEISFVEANPILQVGLRSSRGPIRRGFVQADSSYSHLDPIPIRADPLREERSSELLAAVMQVMTERETSPQLNALLDQILQLSLSFERGEITAENRIQELGKILSELKTLHEQRVAPRGNVARSIRGSMKIVNLITEEIGEEAFELPPCQHASIISHPTLAPLQLDREVTAYVGGHLMVAEAQRVTILCEAEGDPAPKITWFRNGNKLPEKGKRQYILLEGSLRLLYPQLEDAGTYTCTADNCNSSDSKKTILSVMKKPEILSTTSTLEDFTSDKLEATVGSDIRAKLGARITIKCPTEGYPEPYVVWRKDASGLGQNTKVLADNSLEIYPATAAYQGLFGCEASNPAGSDYQASSLVLVEPPRISDELNVLPDIDGVFGLPELLVTGERTEMYEVKANSTVMMGCPVTGFPEPKISWLYNDQPLAGFEYQLMKKNRVLQISHANFQTAGTYSCVAQNDGGNLTTRLQLKLIVYSYQFAELVPCSASCGDIGLQFRRLTCLRDGDREVDEWYCLGLERPALTMVACNRRDCPPKFVLGSWSACSVTCGNGTRTRASSCVVLMSDGSAREVAAEECLRNENRTVESKTCHRRECPQWKVGPWKSCSRRCVDRGFGLRTRKVFCADAEGKKVSRKHCELLPKPARSSRCNNFRCQPVWVASSWSVCSQPCGNRGFKTRILNCVFRGRRKQSAANLCSKRRIPRIRLMCNRKRCLTRVAPRRTVPKRSFGRCVDGFSWCPRASTSGRCAQYRHQCCASCSM